MNAPPVMTSKNDTKILEYQQDDNKYSIEIGTNFNKANFCIKNKNKIDSFYYLEISLEDISKRKIQFLNFFKRFKILLIRLKALSKIKTFLSKKQKKI